MKYQQLLSRIGACIDRLVGIGFKFCDSSHIGKLIKSIGFTNISLIFGVECIYITYQDCIKYTDNFEQELFDKLKEIGIE